LGKANIDHARVLPQILVEVKEDLTFKVKPMKILDWGERENYIIKGSSLLGSYDGAHKLKRNLRRGNL
jgi:hypothetical protein